MAKESQSTFVHIHPAKATRTKRPSHSCARKLCLTNNQWKTSKGTAPLSRIQEGATCLIRNLMNNSNIHPLFCLVQEELGGHIQAGLFIYIISSFILRNNTYCKIIWFGENCTEWNDKEWNDKRKISYSGNVLELPSSHAIYKHVTWKPWPRGKRVVVVTRSSRTLQDGCVNVPRLLYIVCVYKIFIFKNC